jgi:hypothetical protein
LSHVATPSALCCMLAHDDARHVNAMPCGVGDASYASRCTLPCVACCMLRL